MRKDRDRYGRLVGCAMFVGGLVGLAVAGVAQESPASVRGGDLYAKYCSSCHGADGRGKTPLAGRFRAAPPDLTRIAERRAGWFPDIVVREIIEGRFVSHGEREMPVWGGTLSDEQILAVTEYLYSIQRDLLRLPDIPSK